MIWHQTGVTHYRAQLGPLYKRRAIKGLVVCYVVWLGYMKGIGLRTCVGLVPCCGHDCYRAQVPHHPVET